MQSLPVTSLTAGLLAVLSVLLSVQVSSQRLKVGVVFGDGENKVLRRRVRAHGNFVEYAALAVITLGLVEFAGAPRIFTALLAGAFVFCRVLHALGMLYSSSAAPRMTAMIVQHLALLLAGGWLVLHVAVGTTFLAACRAIRVEPTPGFPAHGRGGTW